jgi:hypothetical protein
MKKKINAQKFLVLFAVLLIGLSACNKPEDINTDADDVIENTFAINNNFDDLNTRMTIVREPITVTNNLKVVEPGGDCYDYTWYLVAEVEAPLFEGEPLSASDVRVYGNKAYVTYHRQGDVHAGGIEIIDITDPVLPVIRSYGEFDDADMNTLAVDDRGAYAGLRVFLAGSSKKGAILRPILTNANGELVSRGLDIKLSNAYTDGTIAPSANGIGLSDDYIYMSAGNSFGGTFQLNRNDFSFAANESYSDAKGIALNGSTTGAYQLSLVAGDNAKLKVHHVGVDRSLVHSWDLDPIVHQNVAEPYLGKATLSIREGENVAFIAMNANGVKAINVETGAEVYSSPVEMLTIGNTHGLAIDEKFVYMANSDDGLTIGCLPEDGGPMINVQHWDLDESGASANMVQTDGDWVFVAKGGGGLKILRKVHNGAYPSVCNWDETGAPICIESTELCEDLLADFGAALPENQNAIISHPEYFTNENREIVLTDNAHVDVTFVKEGAGYKNTFGYYTYDVTNPPTSVDDIKGSMKVIYANASAAGLGGSLVEGDKINIGSFEAGTVIGYFVIANGWNGTEVTEGLETFYTIPEFNRDGSQQSIMMYSSSCGSLLTSFEDIHITSGDKDFNDIVIKTSIDPMSAMDTGVVVQLSSSK